MNSGDARGPARAHLLLTVLGKNSRCTRYKLENRETEASLSPIALMELLPEAARPERVLALCTPEAEQGSLPLLEKALGARYPVCPVRMPGGDAQQDIDEFLGKVVGEIEQGVELTVDVTHGFRHFSFLTYVAVLYLMALREVTVRGAYYGMLNPDPNGPSPFLDLRPLLDLPRWVYALEVLRDTGSTLPMARNLRHGRDDQTAGNIARDLERLSESYLSGLPLELGWQARNVLDRWLPQRHPPAGAESGRQTRNVPDRSRGPLRKVLGKGHRLPLAGTLVERLAGILESYAIDEPVRGDGWKRRVRLDPKELGRQAKIVDDLLERKDYATAFRLMREWLVSWAVLRQQAPADQWLDRKVRQRAESTLHAIRAIGDDRDLCGVLNEGQRKLGSFWADLTEVRNAYAHHGMRGTDLVGSSGAATSRDRVEKRWKCTFRSAPAISLSIGESSGRRVLVSPIGRRPGVLFSAVQAVRVPHGEPAPARIDLGDPVRTRCARRMEIRRCASSSPRTKPKG